MRTLKEIEKDIEKTREHLRELYDEHNLALERDVNMTRINTIHFIVQLTRTLCTLEKCRTIGKMAKGNISFM